MAKAIKFGTDGWRGVIADDFTFERVAIVAPIAAQILAKNYGASTGSRTVIVGHDRRFMAEEFARLAATAMQKAGFDVLLTDTYAPTPAFSLAAVKQQALGAIVLTASHNPGIYLGLKVKGAFGGSVSPEITKQIEDLLPATFDDSEYLSAPTPGKLTIFNPWPDYAETLRQKVDINLIKQAITQGKLTVFADVMHGAAAGGLAEILGVPIMEVNSNRDPLFDGGAPEPLPRYTEKTSAEIISYRQAHPQSLTIGLVFDGDSDRIAAIDQDGKFLSCQILIPILIEHLATRRQFTGEVVKTISCSDIFPKIAQLYDLEVFETPIGYKYIADRMLVSPVLVGGEESGGIGYGNHIPERDALLSALYLLEAVVMSGRSLGELYQDLEAKTNFTGVYDRIDLHLANMSIPAKISQQLQSQPPQEIAGQAVTDILSIDGYKFRLADGRWLLIRFSGTEPVLRLYCEAENNEKVQATLNWAKDWANQFT